MFTNSATLWTRGFRVPRVLDSGVLPMLLSGILLAGCATQMPAPPPPVVAEAPKPRKQHIVTAAEILAAQPPLVREIVAEHEPGSSWPAVRHGGTVLYPYQQGITRRVDSASMRTTDIALEPGETVTDVALGDSQRWGAWPASSGSTTDPVPHIVIRPEMDGIASSLTIYTTRRLYDVELRSGGRNPMHEVSFYYPDDLTQAMMAANEAAKQPAAPGTTDINESPLPDASHLNFAYKVDGPRLPWTPERVFDDGSRVYLEMPESIAHTSAPALMLDAGGGRQMVNYRVVPDGDGGSYYVVDSLFSKAELISGVGRDSDRVLISYAGAGR